MALGGEQAARFRRSPVVEARENAALEAVQGVLLGVARSRPLDLRQGVDDEHAGDLEHGRGDDEGRVGVLQPRPLLELTVNALEALAVLANGFLDCLLGPVLVNRHACRPRGHVVGEEPASVLLFLRHLAVRRRGDLQLLGDGAQRHDAHVVQAVLDLVEGQALVVRDCLHLRLHVVRKAAVQLEVVEAVLEPLLLLMGEIAVAAHQEAERRHVGVDEVVTFLARKVGPLLDAVTEPLDARLAEARGERVLLDGVDAALDGRRRAGCKGRRPLGQTHCGADGDSAYRVRSPCDRLARIGRRDLLAGARHAFRSRAHGASDGFGCRGGRIDDGVPRALGRIRDAFGGGLDSCRCAFCHLSCGVRSLGQGFPEIEFERHPVSPDVNEPCVRRSCAADATRHARHVSCALHYPTMCKPLVRRSEGLDRSVQLRFRFSATSPGRRRRLRSMRRQ